MKRKPRTMIETADGEKISLQDALTHEIAQRALALKAMSPEDRARLLREEAEARNAREIDAMRLDETKLAEVMDGLAVAFKNVRPCSQEAYAEHLWQTSTVPSLEAIGVPDRHRKRVTDWRREWPAGMEANGDLQREKFDRVKTLCRGTGAVVALCGKRGTGKSTIAFQVMRERMETRLAWKRLEPALRVGPEPPEAGMYEKLTRLGALFKPLFAGFGAVNQGVLSGLYAAWQRVPFLVLDEVHDAEGIAPAMAMLVDLVDRRHAERRDTVLITNRTGNEFLDTINPSIVSRISAGGAVLACDWASMRAANPNV